MVSAIKIAAKKRVLLDITYRDSKGSVTSRRTEPYELRDDSYFGYDVNKNGIRNFKLDQIMSAKATDIPYIAQWPVMIN